MTTPILGITELADGQIDQYITANEAFRELEKYFTQLRINAQTGTTYTLVLADAGKLVSMTNAAANDLAVPPNSSVAFPVGSIVYILQGGAGQTAIVEGSGVTVETSQTLLSKGQHSMLALIKTATNTWVLTGEREF